MESIRGFIAIDLHSTPQIIDFVQKITTSGADIKLVDLKIIHITLKFLGDVNENKIDFIDQIIKNSIQEIHPFTIHLKGTGVFPNENYMKVVWIGIQKTEPIKRITNTLEEQLEPLGFMREKRNFSPHLTIGRVRTAKNKPQLLKVLKEFVNIEFGEQEITSIKMKKSDLTPAGPIYTTLREIPL